MVLVRATVWMMNDYALAVKLSDSKNSPQETGFVVAVNYTSTLDAFGGDTFLTVAKELSFSCDRAGAFGADTYPIGKTGHPLHSV